MHTSFFHAASGCVRFWVPIAGIWVGASVSKATLQGRYAAAPADDDALLTFRAHEPELQDAVRRRVARGGIELVVVGAADLKPA